MALSNIVSIAALLNIIKHHRIIIHHDSTTLKSHSTTHIYHRSSAHCLFNIVLQILGKLTSCYLLKILKHLHEYIAWHTFMTIGEMTEFTKFYSSDINRYRSFKLLKKISVEIFTLLYS